MRRVVVISIAVFALIVLSKSAHSQGRWVYYQDSNSGATLKCFMPYEGAICNDQAVIQQLQNHNSYKNQQQGNRTALVPVTVVVVQPRRQRLSYTEPYEEQQEQEVTETVYGGGIDRWSRQPYGHYEVRNRKYRARVSGSGRRGSVLIQIPYFYWSQGYSW